MADSASSAPLASKPLPGDFTGSELAKRPDDYILELGARVRTELGVLLDAIGRGDADREKDVQAALADATARTMRSLTTGHGLILVRGVPVEGHSRDTVAKLYEMWGRALGNPQPQNLEGELLTDIRDTGANPDDPDIRLYKTRAEQDFHTDGADVIGLLCLNGAKSGGESRIVSSARVYQTLRERRPELAPLLFQPWWFAIPGARSRGLPEAMPRSIATFDGSKLETFFIGWYIRNAQRFDSVPRLTDGQRELLEVYEGIANEPSLYLDMHFRPGDVQWLRNAFVLHKRTAYVDFPEPGQKRHLLRLWLSAPGIDDSMPSFSVVGRTPA